MILHLKVHAIVRKKVFSQFLNLFLVRHFEIYFLHLPIKSHPVASLCPFSGVLTSCTFKLPINTETSTEHLFPSDK